MKAKAALTAVLTIACTTVLHAQMVYIDSLESNGQLTATTPSNSHYSIEWASSLTPTAQWYRTWAELNNIPGTNMTVEVPMFYRVSCYTNGLIIDPTLDRTYTYQVTNSYGEVWGNDISTHGLTYLPALTNTFLLYSTTYSWSGDMPLGAKQGPDYGFVRITGDTMYLGDPKYTHEVIVWKRAPTGTTWTNGHNEVITVEGYENITVPAGTFTDCIRLHRKDLGSTGSETGHREWIKPGFMLVKEVRYSDFVDPPEAAPMVLELHSWSDD
ncbi:hypothetical protein PDESU_03000 [Pontiella desulfatans]|uniref:Fibronectin type-III domain-containing protein n=1 Tax=Pontiella desulfatans TaxID=2750659 RepID=A0A6C2U3Q9_PONDE|nr:hypothetical protein [Pontiella desulfatans]VGO14439.1 hypothetical protein PDESU_03000 [Pontiella desulfatans]